MHKTIAIITLSLFILGFATLACAFSGLLPSFQAPVDHAATTQAAAAQAGGAIQTVAAAAPEQGSIALATIQASNGPEVAALRDKVANIQPDIFGNYTLTLTDDEINQVLNLTPVLRQADGQVEMQNLVVQFTNGRAILSARLNQPLSANISLTLQPVVLDGQVNFELEQASLGVISVPQFVLNQIEGLVDSALNQALTTVPADVYVQSITVDEGSITIVGRRA